MSLDQSNNISLISADGYTTYQVYDPDSTIPQPMQVNYFRMTTGASKYGQGVILMVQEDYDSATSGSGAVTLNMQSNQGQLVAIPVIITGASLYRTATDPTQNMLAVQLADSRFNATQTISQSFNVQQQGWGHTGTDATDFYPSTLSGGTAQYAWSDVYAFIAGIITNFDASPAPSVAWKPRNLICDSIPGNKVIDRIAYQLFFVVGFDWTSGGAEGKINLNAPGSMNVANGELLNVALGVSDPPNYIQSGGQALRNNGRMPSSFDVVFPAWDPTGLADPFAQRERIINVDTSISGANADYTVPLPAPGYIATYNGSGWNEDSTLMAVANAIAARATIFWQMPFSTYQFAGTWPFQPDGAIRVVEWKQDPRGGMLTTITQDNRVDYDPFSKPKDGIEFPANQGVAGLGAMQSGCFDDGCRVVFGPLPMLFQAKVTSVISGAGGKYNGTDYTGAASDSGTGNYAPPDGLTSGASCLILNLDEQGQPTHWADVSGSKYCQGIYWGMSSESPPRPIIVVDRMVYRTGSPQALLAGTGEIAQTDSWERDLETSGNAYGDVPVSFQVSARVVYNPSSPTPTLYYFYRTLLFAADGRLHSTSAETQVTVDVPDTACT